MADSGLNSSLTLLTPPLSIEDVEPPPFKPLGSDTISLTMKKSGRSAKQRRQLLRGHASSGDVKWQRKKPTQARHSLPRQSLPDMKMYKRPITHPVLSAPGNCAYVDQKLQQVLSERARGSSNAFFFDSRRRSDRARCPRRWTVPSKSRPTHLVCFTNHMPTTTYKKPSDEKSKITPAVIVLRRATTKRERAPSIAQTNLTFFPPPTFSRTSTPLLSFLRMASPQSQVHVGRLSTNTSMTHSAGASWVPSHPRRPSVRKESAQPGCSVTAEPAVTDVMIYSSREHDVTHPFGGPGHRKFSTKIFSRSSVHEIIWDENFISGESNSSSSTISRNSTTTKKRKVSPPPRRQSLAVEKLEMQLREDNSDLHCDLPRNPFELHRTHQTSFQNLLNFTFGEARAKIGDLRALPRSRTSPPSTAPQENGETPYDQRRKIQVAGTCDDTEGSPL